MASNRTLGAVLQGAAADFQSPLYFVLLHYWLQIGANDFWLRLLGVVTGTAIVALVYAAGARWFSPGAGLVAALFAALTSYQVYYSRYPRGYILLALLVLLAAILLERAVTSRSIRWWALHTAAAALALYTHPYALFALPPMWLWAAWRRFRLMPATPYELPSPPASPIGGPVSRSAAPLFRCSSAPPFPLSSGPLVQAVLPIALCALATAVAYLPWLGISWEQLGGVREGADAWIEPVSRDSLKTLLDWLWFKTRLEYGPGWDLLLRASRYLLTAAALFALWQSRRSPGFWLAAVLTAAPALLAYLFSASVVPLWDPRYLVMLSPFFALWLGAAVAGLQLRLLPGAAGRAAPAVAAVLIAAMSLPPLYSLYADPAIRSSDIRSGIAWIRANAGPGELELHLNYQSYLPALWYDRQAARQGGETGPGFAVTCPWRSLPRDWCSDAPYRSRYVNPDLEDLSAAVQGEPRLWLMLVYNHNHPGDELSALRLARQLAEAAYGVAAEATFTGVQVYRLDLKPGVAGATLMP